MAKESSGIGNKVPVDKLKYTLIFVGSVCGAALGIFLLSYALSDKTADLFLASKGVLFGLDDESMQVGEYELLKSLIRSDSVFTPGELISEVSAFYERVITVLTTLLGVLGVVAYMYVKSVSEDNAFKVVKQAVDARFNGHEHSDELSQKMERFVDEKLSDTVHDKMEGLEALQADLEQYVTTIRREQEEPRPNITLRDLDARIRNIEQYISLKDHEEDDDGGGTITPN